jgi:hypothetical protein
MARAYGSNAHMLMTRETVYAKRPPATTSDMPFNHCNLGDEQGLIDDPVLGQGRDPLAPLQDVSRQSGRQLDWRLGDLLEHLEKIETIRDDGLIEGSRRRQSSC